MVATRASAPRPALKNVVTHPSAKDRASYERQKRQAVEWAAALKPDFGNDAEAAAIWDREAPKFTHPEINRLVAKNVQAFKLYCEALAEYTRAMIEYRKEPTFESHGRNGHQIKSSPHFQQAALWFKEATRLGGLFGFSPHDDRGIEAAPELASETDNDFG